MRNNFLKTFLLLAFIGSVENTMAGTSLPYIGPGSSSCGVVSPDTDSENPSEREAARINGGYVPDENCKIIYVKPPVLGRMQINAVMNTRFHECMTVNKEKAFLEKLLESSRTSAKTPKQRAQAYREWEEAINLIDGTFGAEPASWVTGTIDLGWQRVIRAYKDKNPEKDVRALPISLGLFNFFQVDPVDIRDRVLNGKNIIHMRSATGFEFDSTVANDKSFPFPNVVAKLDEDQQKPVLMGQAMNLDLQLTFAGTCALYDTKGAFVQNPAGYLGGTYTYFYPVQTKASYQVTWQDALLEKAIFELTANSQDHSVSAEELMKALSNTAVQVSLNPGAFPGNDEAAVKLRQDYENEIKEYTLEAILGEISEKVKFSVASNTELVDTVQTTRKCKKKLGIIRSCSNHRYVVTTKKINWVKVGETLKSLINPISAEASQYSSIYMMDTAAFEPAFKK